VLNEIWEVLFFNPCVEEDNINSLNSKSNTSFPVLDIVNKTESTVPESKAMAKLSGLRLIAGIPWP